MSNSTLLAHNTLWNALERFSTMGIQLVCTFVLARFLSPSDFGLVGMLVVFTLIGNTLTESGFSQALIRERDIPHSTLSTVFWTNVVLSLLIYLLLYAAAPLIAGFYAEPQLTDVSRVTFLVIPLGALSLIHYTICTRAMQFRRMCLISLSASFVSCVVAVYWAWQTHSVWALVIQNVAAYALRAIGYWVSDRWLPSLQFSWNELRRLFRFSRNLLITGIIGNLFNNIYTLLIGRFYGATEAGYFVQADRIRMVASTSSTQVIQSVSYPILSRLNNGQGFDNDTQSPTDVDPSPADTDRLLLSAYRRIILITLLLVGFFMALLMSVSEDLMELLMGSYEWRISGRYLMALGVAGILFPLHAVNQNILLVKGLGSTVLWIEVARRSLMVLLLIVAVQFSVEVFVWSYALYSFLLIFLNLWVCGRPIGYGLRAQLRDIRPILTALLVMVVASICLNHLLALQALWLRLPLTLCLTALTGLLLLHRHPAFREALSLIRGLLHHSSNDNSLSAHV